MIRKSVIIATPDVAQRTKFANMVDQMAGFRVIALTSDLMNTYNEVEERLPKAVLIADVLANLPEFEVMRALFSALDVRWLVLSNPESDRTALGQPGYRPNPGSDLFAVSGNAHPDQVFRQLCSLTRTEPSRVPVRKTEPQVPGTRTGSFSAERLQSIRAIADRKLTPAVQPLARVASTPGRVILIGSSTGGVDALLNVLSVFPENCPPTLIVQHTGIGFGHSLVGLLNRQCAAEVRLADGDIQMRPGLIVVGAGISAHLVLRDASRLIAGLDEGPAISGHRPSVDRLFHSAVNIGPHVSAAILTGMGRDGADGLRALRSAGARTLAQDEASCVVYGMPRAAVELGAADAVLPLGRIGAALVGSAAGLTNENNRMST